MSQPARTFRLTDEIGAGVACDETGLFLGETALLERGEHAGPAPGWRPRPLEALNADVGARYGLPVDLSAKLGGLAAVAGALNRGELALARIAALHLRLPDPPPLAKASLGDDDLIDLVTRLHEAGFLGKLEDWDESKHNRWPAGSPDSQGGRFAPGGAGGGAAGITAGQSDGSARPAQAAAPKPPVVPGAAVLASRGNLLPPLSVTSPPSFFVQMAAHAELTIGGFDQGDGVTPGDKEKFANAMRTLAAGLPVSAKDMTPAVSDWLSKQGHSEQLAEIQSLLLKAETRRNDVYIDSTGHLTVGIGHKVAPTNGLKLGDIITDQQIDAFFQKDSTTAYDAALSQASQAGITDQSFIRALASVNFQNGAHWTTKYYDAWALIKDGQYATAAADLGGTGWFKESPFRVKTFQDALLALPPPKETN